jgi:Trk-type K+ transport system membrane component
LCARRPAAINRRTAASAHAWSSVASARPVSCRHACRLGQARSATNSLSCPTPFGQAFILLLIQLGGLGIVTFTTVAILTFGRRLSLRAEELSASGV